MTPSDFAALHAKAFSTTRAWTSVEFEKLIEQKGTVWHGDNTCFVLMRVIADEAEILTLATDPAHRRQGLARKVLSDGENKAAQAGATKLFLEVAEDNVAARALYQAAGFVQVGRRPGYYVPKDGAPIAALVLRKEL